MKWSKNQSKAWGIDICLMRKRHYFFLVHSRHFQLTIFRLISTFQQGLPNPFHTQFDSFATHECMPAINVFPRIFFIIISFQSNTHNHNNNDWQLTQNAETKVKTWLDLICSLIIIFTVIKWLAFYEFVINNEQWNNE